jgi:hypothetical protein
MLLFQRLCFKDGNREQGRRGEGLLTYSAVGLARKVLGGNEGCTSENECGLHLDEVLANRS